MPIYTPVENNDNAVIKQSATPDRYVDLGNYLDSVNKPDNRDVLVKNYGSQLISGPLSLCELVGAEEAVGTNDEVTYWEEKRLHKTQDGTIASTSASDTGAKLITTATNHSCIVNDTVLIDGYVRALVTTVNSATSYSVTPLKATWGVTFAANQFVKVAKYGAMWTQGGDQPTDFELSNLDRRTQGFAIYKSIYTATGSQMGNIGWVKDENGSLYWYHKGLEDFRKRAKNYHESMAVFGVNPSNPNMSSLNGFQGYTDTVEDRGVVAPGYLEDIADLQNLSVILDKQGAPEEYMFFSNRIQSNKSDNMIAGAIEQPSYGVFSNGDNMAVNLGFKSVKVGGRTFHNKPLPILIDPTFGGQTDYYKWFMVPMGSVTDPKTGIQAPTLQKNYKGYASGTKRYMESWVTGGADGTYTNGKDSQTFNLRSEFNLITRGPNRHAIGAGN